MPHPRKGVGHFFSCVTHVPTTFGDAIWKTSFCAAGIDFLSFSELLGQSAAKLPGDRSAEFMYIILTIPSKERGGDTSALCHNTRVPGTRADHQPVPPDAPGSRLAHAAHAHPADLPASAGRRNPPCAQPALSLLRTSPYPCPMDHPSDASPPEQPRKPLRQKINLRPEMTR